MNLLCNEISKNTRALLAAQQDIQMRIQEEYTDTQNMPPHTHTKTLTDKRTQTYTDTQNMPPHTHTDKHTHTYTDTRNMPPHTHTIGGQLILTGQSLSNVPDTFRKLGRYGRHLILSG